MRIPMTAVQVVNDREVDVMALSPLSAYLTVTFLTLFCTAQAMGCGGLLGSWVLTSVWVTLSWVFPVALCALYGGFRPEAPDNRRRYAR